MPSGPNWIRCHPIPGVGRSGPTAGQALPAGMGRRPAAWWTPAPRGRRSPDLLDAVDGGGDLSGGARTRPGARQHGLHVRFPQGRAACGVQGVAVAAQIHRRVLQHRAHPEGPRLGQPPTSTKPPDTPPRPNRQPTPGHRDRRGRPRPAPHREPPPTTMTRVHCSHVDRHHDPSTVLSRFGRNGNRAGTTGAGWTPVVDRWWLNAGSAEFSRVSTSSARLWRYVFPGFWYRTSSASGSLSRFGTTAAAVEGERDLGDQVLNGEDFALAQGVGHHRVVGPAHEWPPLTSLAERFRYGDDHSWPPGREGDDGATNSAATVAVSVNCDVVCR